MRRVFRDRSIKGTVELLYVDLFCGAGGVTSGVVRAKLFGQRCAKVLYCVNHDANAIKSHKANHKRTKHSVEDIRSMDLADLIRTVNYWRKVYPHAKLVLWASLECTHFSKARGGLPRDADSRTLAYSLFRYIEAINPDYIQIENVIEFMSWGPMRIRAKKHYKTHTELSWIKDKKTGEERYGWQPIDKMKGADYIEWKRQMQEYGYDFQHKVINCADLGAYTSRKRYFGIFSKYGLPVVFPEQTHFKKPKPGQKRWKAVRRVLDLHDHGESIFNRKKPLVDKTFERVYDGLIKYIAGGKDQYMIKWNSMSKKGVYHAPSVDEPCPAVTCQNRLGFLSMNYTNGGNLNTLENPCPTLPCKDMVSKVQPEWIDKYYGSGGFHSSVQDPASTLTQRPKLGLLTTQPAWIDEGYSNVKSHKSVEQPAGAVVVNSSKMNLLTPEPVILDMQYNNSASSINDPLKTITADRRWFHIMNPQYKNKPGSVEEPCVTIIARQDKAPLHLMVTEEGELAIEVFPDDTEIVVKIKHFMALYGISDIKMRMLNIRELKLITGFRANYTLIGNQSEQKKFIGNAVPVVISKCWTECLAMELRKIRELELAHLN